MASREDIARSRDNLQGEIDGAALYRTMAEMTTQPQLAEVYRRLAAIEERPAPSFPPPRIPPRRPMPVPFMDTILVWTRIGRCASQAQRSVNGNR